MTDYNPDHGAVPDDESASELLSGLLGDAKDLALAHADKIRNEVRTELDGIKGTVARTSVALAGAVIAGVVLAHALALAISALTGLPAWAGLGIVGVLLALGAYLLVQHKSKGMPRSAAALEAVGDDVARIADVVS